MEQATANLLAAGSEWLESVVVIGFLVMSVLGNIAKAWIKRVKEKKERQNQQPGGPAKPPSRPRAAFPAAQPRAPQPPARPPNIRPTSAKPPAPAATPVQREPQTQPQPPTPLPTGIPRELLPEGLEEALGEILPDFLQPKKPTSPQPKRREAPPQRRQPAEKTSTTHRAPPTARHQSKKTEAESDSGAKAVSKRLGGFHSSIAATPPKKSGIAAHVTKHMGEGSHKEPDAVTNPARISGKIPSRAALRHAIIMSEILAKPRALRPFEDNY